MKRISVFCLALILLSLMGCYKTAEKMSHSDNELVLSYPAKNQFNLAASGINYWTKALINPDLGKMTDTLLFSLNLKEAVSRDITVNLGVDDQAVALYNQDTLYGPTQYALMPETYYSIVTPTLIIPAGTTDTTFKVAISPNMMDISQTGYLLPVSIKSVEGIQKSVMHTAFIHIEKDPNPPYSRSDWSVVAFSSQEAVGEGPNNGRVVFLFDNNPSTFWHSQWQDALPGPPHWFTVNMNATHELHGIMILDRQGVGSSGRPKEVKVEVSSDNIAWTTVDNFTLADKNTWQKVKFNSPTASVQYFKVTILSMYGDASVKYTNMAELKLF
ncbi:discoidin domain-containing protein [Arachidicoccus terrestris]|uniref:discoidin domain-containing protein n=1 Tax=Arachidicoccus terrestris TaxID=2875539 RepID=UPI001CC6E628|nr:discoidin domain-containing protein [Arachidicoccus terrestris]UAY55367.1 discoidin domain-containing protein [Arachidicoccus terrestris]